MKNIRSAPIRNSWVAYRHLRRARATVYDSRLGRVARHRYRSRENTGKTTHRPSPRASIALAPRASSSNIRQNDAQRVELDRARAPPRARGRESLPRRRESVGRARRDRRASSHSRRAGRPSVDARRRARVPAVRAVVDVLPTRPSRASSVHRAVAKNAVAPPRRGVHRARVADADDARRGRVRRGRDRGAFDRHRARRLR